MLVLEIPELVDKGLFKIAFGFAHHHLRLPSMPRMQETGVLIDN